MLRPISASSLFWSAGALLPLLRRCAQPGSNRPQRNCSCVLLASLRHFVHICVRCLRLTSSVSTRQTHKLRHPPCLLGCCLSRPSRLPIRIPTRGCRKIEILESDLKRECPQRRRLHPRLAG